MVKIPKRLYKLSEKERNTYLVAAYDAELARRVISGAWDTEAFKWLMNYIKVLRACTRGKMWTSDVKKLNKCINNGKSVCTECGEVIKQRCECIAHHIEQFPYIFKNFLECHIDALNNDNIIEMLFNYEPLWDITNGVVVCRICHNRIHHRRSDRGKKRSKRIKIVGYN